MAHDTETGAVLWSTDIPDGAKAGEALPEAGEETGLAASTPACDETPRPAARRRAAANAPSQPSVKPSRKATP